MQHEGREERFFGFYTMTLGILMGLGLAGNLLTLYMFYEMMTLITVPLVIHNGSREAVAAGFKYLGYSTFGAGLALIGFFFLNRYCSTTEFSAGGTLDFSLAAVSYTHLEICLFGLVISGAIYLFAIKLLDYDPKKELKALKKLGGIFHFLLVLLRDIIKASFHVIGVILSPKKEVDPKLVFFYTDLSTDTGRVGLANAITLTPGTITVFCEHELFCVHALDTASQADVDESQFMHLLKKLED